MERAPGSLAALQAEPGIDVRRNRRNEGTIRTMGAETSDKQIICEMLKNSVAWRDAADWVRFRSLSHDDGYLVTMWFQGPVGEFVRLASPRRYSGFSRR